MEELSDFEAEHSHPPPNTQAPTSSHLLSFLVPPKPWAPTGETQAHDSMLGLRLAFARLGYKAEPKIDGDPLSVPCTQVLFPSELVLSTQSKLLETVWGGNKHLGNSWR